MLPNQKQSAVSLLNQKTINMILRFSSCDDYELLSHKTFESLAVAVAIRTVAALELKTAEFWER